MKLRAKKTTSNPCLVRHRESDGGYLDTFHVEGGDIIEINLDDFEVIECECIKHCWSEPGLRKTWCSCKHGTKEMELTQKPVETPNIKWEANTNRGDFVYFDQEVIDWMKQVTKAINKLQESQ